jgi:multidrug efflux system membrane fusion protein
MASKIFNRATWLFCMLIALTACKEKTEIVEVVRAIKTITIKEQPAGQILRFSGLVAAVDSSGLSFQVGGQVAGVHVDIGDRVVNGQVLAELDPESYQLEVDAVKAELVKARDNATKSNAQYERHKRIYEQGAGAKGYLDVVEYNYKAAVSVVDFQLAKLDLAKRNLRKTKLLSPYDGTIAMRSVQPHEEVQTGQELFQINATGKMEVQLAVPETAIDRVTIDDTATITFPTLPGASVEGHITYIGTAAIQANSFPVKVVLNEPNAKIKPGMTAEANLTVMNEHQTPGYLVPLQAFLPRQEANRGFVFVYDPQLSMVKKIPVHARGIENEHAIVSEGLAAGDIIAVAGVSFLSDEMKVKLMKQ